MLIRSFIFAYIPETEPHRVNPSEFWDHFPKTTISISMARKQPWPPIFHESEFFVKKRQKSG